MPLLICLFDFGKPSDVDIVASFVFVVVTAAFESFLEGDGRESLPGVSMVTQPATWWS